MKSLSFTISAAAICVAALPAAADVTAADLWADWQTNAAAMGNTMSAEVSQTGQGITLSGLTIESTAQGATTTQSFDEVQLIENGGGVEVVFSQPLRMQTEIVENGQTLGNIEFLGTFENLDVRVSGDPENLNYDYSADSITLRQGNMTSTDGSMPQLNMDFTVLDAAASYALTGAAGARGLLSDGSFGGLSLELDMIAPEGETGRLKLSLAMGPFTSSGGGSMSALQDFMQNAAVAAPGTVVPLPEGFGFDAAIDYSSLSYDIQFDEPGNSFTANGGNAGGSFSFEFTADALSYDLSSRDVTMAMSGVQFPFPIEASAGSTGSSMLIPLSAQPEPSPIAVSLNYSDLVVNEAIWSTFDPGRAIPRNPATVRLNITGLVQIFTDLMNMDPTQFAGPPGEMRQLSLNELLISAAGAELMGSGAVEFQPGSFPPMPVGSVNLSLEGLNALLERLVGAGLLPVEQAGMVGAMTGMFARPGARPDTLESTIDFLPGGGITANGVPLR